MPDTNPQFGRFIIVIDGTSRAALSAETVLAADEDDAIAIMRRRGATGVLYAVPFKSPKGFTLVSQDMVNAIIKQAV